MDNRTPMYHHSREHSFTTGLRPQVSGYERQLKPEPNHEIDKKTKAEFSTQPKIANQLPPYYTATHGRAHNSPDNPRSSRRTSFLVQLAPVHITSSLASQCNDNPTSRIRPGGRCNARRVNVTNVTNEATDATAVYGSMTDITSPSPKHIRCLRQSSK